MPVCPACDADNLPGSPACRKCGLSTELFEPIRSAVGLPRGSPQYEAQVRALIEAMGDLAVAPPASDEARITPTGRFPTTSEGSGVVPGLSIHDLPKRAPSTGGTAELRGEIAALRRLDLGWGAEEPGADERARSIVERNDPGELDRFAGELFVRVAARLTDRYGAELGRRAELAQFLPVPEVDALLAEARAALAGGRLDLADQRLRTAAEALERLEEEWGTTEVLLKAALDLEATIRELGGDPAAAMGPVEEARRRIRALDRTGAEPLLAHSTVGLWTILNPLLEKDLARRIEEVRLHQAAGTNVEAVVADLKEFASQVKQSNFSAAVAFYRRGVDRLSALGDASRATAPPINTDPSVPST
jgi:hypothetical protein